MEVAKGQVISTFILDYSVIGFYRTTDVCTGDKQRAG